MMDGAGGGDGLRSRLADRSRTLAQACPGRAVAPGSSAHVPPTEGLRWKTPFEAVAHWISSSARSDRSRSPASVRVPPRDLQAERRRALFPLAHGIARSVQSSSQGRLHGLLPGTYVAAPDLGAMPKGGRLRSSIGPFDRGPDVIVTGWGTPQPQFWPRRWGSPWSLPRSAKRKTRSSNLSRNRPWTPLPAGRLVGLLARR